MRRPLPLAAALAVLTLLWLPAHAHQKRVVRTATASARAVAGGVELDVMLWMRFAGPRAEAMRARFDLDRSGRLDGGETTLAGDALAPETIGGFFVRVDGSARAPYKAEARARSDGDAVEVAVLLSWSARPAATIQLASRAGRDRADAPVILARFAALPPLTVTGRTPSADGPTPLLPGGDGLTVQIAAAPAAEKKTER